MVYRLERILLYTFVVMNILLMAIIVMKDAESVSEKKLEKHAIIMGAADYCQSIHFIQKCLNEINRLTSEPVQQEEKEETEININNTDAPCFSEACKTFKWNQTEAKQILEEKYNLNGGFFK